MTNRGNFNTENIPVLDEVPEGYMTTREMAKMLGFSNAVLSKYCRMGVLNGTKIRIGSTRLWIVTEKDAMTFVPPNPRRGKKQKHPGRWHKAYLEKIMSVTHDPWEALANAIVATACRDYQRCLEGGNEKVGEFKSLQKFFRSSWFAFLTRFQINPDTMMQTLEDEVYQYIDWRTERAEALGISYDSPVLDYEETSGKRFEFVDADVEDIDEIIERALKGMEKDKDKVPVDKTVDKAG